MGFLDKLLGRKPPAGDLLREPTMGREGAQEGMAEDRYPGEREAEFADELREPRPLQGDPDPW